MKFTRIKIDKYSSFGHGLQHPPNFTLKSNFDFTKFGHISSNKPISNSLSYELILNNVKFSSICLMAVMLRSSNCRIYKFEHRIFSPTCLPIISKNLSAFNSSIASEMQLIDVNSNAFEHCSHFRQCFCVTIQLIVIETFDMDENTFAHQTIGFPANL